MNIPTAWAMQITGVNRIRFNEAVASGFYKCAPTTEYRKSRRFDTADIIGLSAFGRMLNAGLSHRVAAGIACDVVQNVRSYGDDLEAVVVAWKANGERWTGPWFGEGKAGVRPHLDPNGSGYAMLFQFHIRTIGKDVFQRYHELNQSAGFDDASQGDDA